MINQDKLNLLKPNIRQVVRRALTFHEIQVYSGDGTFTETNANTIEKIKEQIVQFKEYKQSNLNIRVSIAPLWKQKQIYKIMMIGRLNTFIQDKKINAYIFFSDDYPKSPPVVYFESINVNGDQERFQHINVWEDGQLCQQIVKGKFNQTLHIKDLLLAIEKTLYEPNPLSAANTDLAYFYQQEDKSEYNSIIRKQAACLEWAEDDS